MPVRHVTEKGKPGYQWGSTGKVYTYTPGNAEEKKEAQRRAALQGRAIEASKRYKPKREDAS
jgi:hypothetical protein